MEELVAAEIGKVMEERDARRRLKKRQRKLEKKLAKVQRKLEKTKRRLEQRLAKVKRKLEKGRREAAAPAVGEIESRKAPKRVIAKPKKIRARAPKKRTVPRAASRMKTPPPARNTAAPAAILPAKPGGEKEKILGS